MSEHSSSPDPSEMHPRTAQTLVECTARFGDDTDSAAGYVATYLYRGWSVRTCRRWLEHARTMVAAHRMAS